jgi:hypothetical protein
MREESPQSFPQPNYYNYVEGVCAYIKLELEKVGINPRKIGISIGNNVITVTTNKKVPEETMSNIRKDADYNGFTIKFLTSGEKY